MVKIIVGEDCGNSRKMIFLKEFQFALANQDNYFILENITDDIRWKFIGERQVSGKVDLAKELHRKSEETVHTLTINTVITHGNLGAVEGVVKLENGHSYAFCDVYKFNKHGKNAKIKKISTFRIHNGDSPASTSG